MKRRWRNFLRIVHAGMVNSIRNASLAIAAMAVMIVTLTIVLVSLIANATFSYTIHQTTDKIDISAYLKDDVTPAQTAKLISDLKKQPNVAQVDYISKAQALQELINSATDATKRASIEAAGVTTGNPLPATLHIKPRDINKINDLKPFLDRADVKVLFSEPTSYSGDLKQIIDNIARTTTILRRIGIVTVAIFAIVSVLIIFNTIQMAIFNRRDEIQIMRLLGASTNFIRGPFIVENFITGALSGIVSVLIVHSVFTAASSTLQATSFGLLDINHAVQYFNDNFWKFLGLQLMVGILIGTGSSVIATRRYLKFKVR